MTGFRAYQLLTWFLWPVFWGLLLRRRWIGKELPFRVRERRGIATKTRIEGPLIWFHGASIGETLSILPLANHMAEQFPEAELLITSGTITSANLIANRLPDRAQHQFLPLDHPVWVERFLRYWQPDIGIWVESEIWPNLVQRCHHLDIPLHLVNARLSDKSYQRWERRPRLARLLLSAFESVIAQSGKDADRFASLGASAPVNGGNIKFAGEALPAGPTEVDAWRAAFLGRPIWFAANTHPGEEDMVLKAHEELKLRHPGLLTIIGPRHIDRIEDLQTSLLADRPHALYTEGSDLVSSHSVLIVDQLGVLGPLYQTCGIALVAGSLVPDVGGHNPIEPARNGAAVLIGLHIENQSDLVDLFIEQDALIQISDAASLVDAVDFLLSDEERRSELQLKARQLVEDQANVLRLYSSALVPKIKTSLARKFSR